MPETPPSVPRVRLLGGLALLRDGRRTPLPAGSHRLLAHLALHPEGGDRRAVAHALWPDAGESRAAGNLRTAWWRLQQVGCPLAQEDDGTLALRPEVVVDLTRLDGWMTRVLTGSATPADLAVDPAAIAEADLLPGWQEAWVVRARERLHLRRVHALERLGVLLRRAGHPTAAVEAARLAVVAEPLRESGQRALIEAHQAAGNWAVARQQFDVFRRILRREVGAEPSPALAAVATRRRG
ncbi:UNVERIFIED_ORG: transcriptional regulator [Bacillus sp. AZ43]